MNKFMFFLINSEFQKYKKTHFLFRKISPCHYRIGGSEIGQKVQRIFEMASTDKIVWVFLRVSKQICVTTFMDDPVIENVLYH